ncbi:MAG: hypothetical protein IT176_09925 [Acidobacteria bacterium]|nr:hypothetical protein [Acidobacteriota bacterium]
MRSRRRAGAAAGAAIAVLLAGGCGKKGPPLPPLVRVPAAPGEVAAARRGDEVIVDFTVPSANADGSRPANLSRIDVYAVTAPAAIPADRVMALGSKIGSVAVKSPLDPALAVEPGESAGSLPPLQGDGLDQGARGRIAERLTPESLAPIAWPAAADAVRRAPGPASRAAVAADAAARPVRTYVAVSVDTRGRAGGAATRVSVPVAPAPPAPATPTVTYDETAVTVAWQALDDGLRFHVYEVPAAPAAETRLTSEPIAGTRYSDSRIVWGATRCYTLRAVAIEAGLPAESGAPPPACVTLTDTFAPAAPSGLSGVASEGGISLIWDPNRERDLAGYVVMRGAPGSPLEPMTPAPIQATTFNDPVPAGVPYVYAIVAVDTAGNRSPESTRFEDAGRN